jgi:hypothetical protein
VLAQLARRGLAGSRALRHKPLPPLRPTRPTQVRVEGLGGGGYTDSLQGGKPLTQEGPIVFREEVDRIYLKTPQTIKVLRVQAGWERGGGVCGAEERRQTAFEEDSALPGSALFGARERVDARRGWAPWTPLFHVLYIMQRPPPQKTDN